MSLRLPVIGLLSFLVPGVAWAQSGQEGDTRTVQDGVFSQAQAERGRIHYESLCQNCHGTDLRGGRARTLSGEDFMRNWRGLTIGDLFDRLQTMPPSANINLDEKTYLDIMSHILDANEFPSGKQALTADRLQAILIEGAEGPQEVPDHSLVQVVGCLTRSANDTWLVIDATDPIRTRDPNPSDAADLEPTDTPLGNTGSFELLYVFPNPDAMEGHLVEAKGFLIRGDQDALNVTSVSTIAPTCR